MNFFNLHGHTTYSMLDGYGTPEQIAGRLVELGQKGASITDHGNVNGHATWQKELKKKGLKPLFGCEFYVVSDITNKSATDPIYNTEGNQHLSVTALTQKGYENLLKLVTFAQTDGYYRVPKITWDKLFELQDGLLVMSGCVSSTFSKLIRIDREDTAHTLAEECKERIENFYIEIVPEPDIDVCYKAETMSVKVARDLNIPMIITADAHFPRAEDFLAQDVSFQIGMGKTHGDPNAIHGQPYQYYCTPEELLDRAKRSMAPEVFDRQEMIAAIERSFTIAETSHVEIPIAKPFSFYKLGGITALEYITVKIEEGLKKRFPNGQRPKEYIERIQHELDAFTKGGFIDYILCISDVAEYARSIGGLCVCRGSAGGSLLLWALECSDTDSLEHDLLFQRFFDENRLDPPDVDMDFQASVREKVFQYITDMCGADKCGRLMSNVKMHGRNAIIDVARYYRIPQEAYKALTLLIDSKNDDMDDQFAGLTDPVALGILAEYPQLQIVRKLVGQCRNKGIHAAGMVISSEPLTKNVASGTFGTENRIISVDKYSAPDVGLHKLDLLVVSALDIIQGVCEKIGISIEELKALPLDDPKVYEFARKGKVAGIFQLDGIAMQVAYKIGLDTFQDLYAASALCRPGAISFVDTYAANKQNPAKFEQYCLGFDPRIVAILRPTYGVILYQEQVMRLCKEVANLSWPMVHAIRKKITSSASITGYDISAEFYPLFRDGCLDNGITESAAAELWNRIKAHGVYSFNKPHCVTYGIVGYHMLWLKTYYPDAYYEVFLSLEGKDGDNILLIKRLIREYVALGNKVKVIDFYKSTMSFSSTAPGEISGGWGNLKGIGTVTAHKICQKIEGMAGNIKLTEVFGGGILSSLITAGVLSGEYNPSEIAKIAPWMPVLNTPKDLMEIRDKANVTPANLLTEEKINGNIIVSGYITVKKKLPRVGMFTGDKYVYFLEDERGSVECRFSKANQSTLGVKCDNDVSVSDYVAFIGWWSGNILYISSHSVIVKG